mmetsp:Transcript_16327/g.51315  ORF Transcript_16327/g.51315 Transcript_16327/m.51315 type:complete len:88 (+) Transcript_16327:195-458(+)
MAQQDSFYSRLGVHTTATVDEIKKAYREKAKEYHPDLNPGEDSGVKFQAMTEAYEVGIFCALGGHKDCHPPFELYAGVGRTLGLVLA